jgi:hypothetical protein
MEDEASGRARCRREESSAERERRRRRSTHWWCVMKGAAMAATAAHAGATAAPGQAKPQQRRSYQQPRRGTRPHRSARDADERRIFADPCGRGADALGKSRGGRERQIDADHHVRRRETVQIRTRSSPMMAGGGRSRAATAEAISVSREPERGIRVTGWRTTKRLGRLDRAHWAGPT